MSKRKRRQNAQARSAAAGDANSVNEVMLGRINWMKQHGITFQGARDFYEIFGYDRQLTARQYREEYCRGGIAGRIVDAYPVATWRGLGELVEDESPDNETPFETAWWDLSERLKIWPMLKRVDILAGQGRYAVLLIGTTDGNLSSELPKGQPEQLQFLTPFNEDDASIQEWEQDVTSSRFGLPKTYLLKRLDVTSPALTKPVHFSRLLHVAENTLDNDVYGQPRLERPWNLLIDLAKVTGGGAEAYFSRADQGMVLNFAKDMKRPDQAAVDDLKQQVEEYRHRISRVMRTHGIDVQQLGSDVANFSGPASTVLAQIAGCVGIPQRILLGSEMGQLASGQDRDNWDTQVMDRRTGYAEPNMVRPLVDRLIALGYLPTPVKPYQVRWPEIGNLTEEEKAKGAKAWADTNAAQKKTVFTGAEIRDKWYGMPPLEPAEEEPIGVSPVAALKPVSNFPVAAEEHDDEDKIDRLEAAMREGGIVNLVVHG